MGLRGDVWDGVGFSRAVCGVGSGEGFMTYALPCSIAKIGRIGQSGGGVGLSGGVGRGVLINQTRWYDSVNGRNRVWPRG